MSLKVIHYNFTTIDSTNSWAIQNFHSFDKNAVTIVTAKEQTKGRGRLNREWNSPLDMNLYSTFCFFIKEENFSLSNVPQILALSTVQLLNTLGIDAKIKWPNDVLIDGKKIAGILCEIKSIESHRFVALGIGINVNMEEENLKKIDKPATSISFETGNIYDLDAIQILLNEIFLKNLDLLFKQGFSPFYREFENKIYRPEELLFNDNSKIIKGTIHSFNEDGSLTLLFKDGSTKTYHYGEIL